MNGNIWDKFDREIDTEGLAKDVEEAAANGGGNFKEVPHDTYEVEINKLEMTTSKKGDPMLSCWMKIIDGEYKGSLIFMNQVVTQGFQIHIANEFLRSLISEVEDADKPDVIFKTYNQYNGMVMERVMPVVKEWINSGYENIAVVTHGGLIRILLCTLFGGDFAKRLMFGKSLENCSITQINYDKDKNGFFLERFNDYAHIEAEPGLLRRSFAGK